MSENEIVENGIVEEKPAKKNKQVAEPAQSTQCIVVSKASFPITIKYAAEEIILSPRARKTFADKAKLTVRPEDRKFVRIV